LPAAGSGQKGDVTSACLAEFTTTHWSVVLAAGETQTPQSAQALEALCRAYWFPLYAYVRRQGYAPEDSRDLTQDFFARFLDKNYVTHALPERGKFRTFLLTSLKHFLVSEWRKTERQVRGGGPAFIPWDADAAEQCYAAEPPGELTAEKMYEKRCAIALMERVLARLRDEYHAADKDRLFEQLKSCVWGNQSAQPYAEMAAELGLTEGAVKTSVHRLRQRCRELLRAEVAHTVARPEDIDEELRHLIDVFSE
jgi:RNA polymerase sigma-70 factor (ECF subfamily)